MKPPKISLAVTGGIGSGKSQVCKLLEEADIAVISADTLGHEALENEAIRQKLTKTFGNQILNGDQIDRLKLSDIIFADAAKTELLNDIVHPFIINKIKEKIKNQQNRLAAYEIPLLFEAGLQNLFDIIIMVWAKEDIRKQRVLTRSGISENKFFEIAQKQVSQETARNKADYVISNNGSLTDLRKEVKSLIKKIETDREGR